MVGLERQASLAIRGCQVRLAGSENREFLLPVYSEDDEALRHRRDSLATGRDRVKATGLTLWSARKVSAEATNDLRFLECRVLPKQPLLQLESTSLILGALMLYDGEQYARGIRFSSLTAVDMRSPGPVSRSSSKTFPPLMSTSCASRSHDSHTAAAEVTLCDAELPPFEAYELDLAMRERPVFCVAGARRADCRQGRRQSTHHSPMFRQARLVSQAPTRSTSQADDV